MRLSPLPVLSLTHSLSPSLLLLTHPQLILPEFQQADDLSYRTDTLNHSELSVSPCLAFRHSASRSHLLVLLQTYLPATLYNPSRPGPALLSLSSPQTRTEKKSVRILSDTYSVLRTHTFRTEERKSNKGKCWLPTSAEIPLHSAYFEQRYHPTIRSLFSHFTLPYLTHSTLFRPQLPSPSPSPSDQKTIGFAPPAAGHGYQR